jgi:hypothetical protein
MFLLNLTMPVTLAAVADTLPGRPAFAFGLTCLALILGAFAAFTGPWLGGEWLVFCVTIASAFALYPTFRNSRAGLFGIIWPSPQVPS